MHDEEEPEGLLPIFRTLDRHVAAVVNPAGRVLLHLHGGRISAKSALQLAYWIIDTFDGGDHD